MERDQLNEQTTSFVRKISEEHRKGLFTMNVGQEEGGIMGDTQRCLYIFTALSAFICHLN